MTDMPEGTLYGRLTGRVSAFIGDTTADTNDLPDRVPTGGRVTVTPSITHVVHKPTGDVIFATPDPIELDDDGHFDVSLVAVDSPDLNPTGWHYTVRVEVPGRTALTAKAQILAGQTLTLGEAIGAAQPGVATAVVKGDKGDPGEDGHSPVVAMNGDQLVIDGVIVGPHLTGPPGDSSAQVEQIDQMRRYLDGYEAISVSDTATVSTTAAGTFALDLTADTTLTIDGKLGQTVALDVVTGGKKLTVVNGPTITADGVYALLMTRGKWKGGATGTASTGGGSTGGTGDTTTPPTDTSATLIGTLDLAGVADGTLASTLELSNGLASSHARSLKVEGGKLVVVDEAREGQISFEVRTPKQRVSATYSLPRYGDARIGIYESGGDKSLPCALRIDNKGNAEFVNPDGHGFTFDTPLPLFPKTGTVSFTFDADTGTGAAYLNGTRLGGFTSPTYTSIPAASRRAGGIYLSLTEPDRSAGPNPVTMSDIKIEALT